MSTVEAAASLFGSDGDSGSDPFAVIGNEVTDNEAIDTTHPLAQNEQQNQASSSYPLHMGQDASSLFAGQMYPDAHEEQPDPWSIPTTQDPASGHSQHSSNAASSYNDQHGYSVPISSTGYEPHSAYAPQPVTRTPYGNSSSTYEPYNPAPATSYQPYNSNQYAGQQYAPVQTTGDPYQPTATTTSTLDTYPPQHPATQQPALPLQQPAAYDKYRTLSRSVSSPYSSTFPTAPQQPPPNVSAGESSQAPPPPAAAAFRPKTLNAYDPPLPPPKVSKRAVSARNPRSTSPAVGHQMLPVYGQTPSCPPPVPPLPALPLLPTAGNLRHGPLPVTVAPPPQSPPGPSPRQREPTQHYDPSQYSALSGSDHLRGSYTPSSSQEHYERSASQTGRYAAPPQDHLVPTTNSGHTQGLFEGTPTPRQTSNKVFKASVPASDSAPPWSHDAPVQQQPEAEAVYTSDDMPWDDPEGGLEGPTQSSVDPFSHSARDSRAPYGSNGSAAYSVHQRQYSQTPPPEVLSPEYAPPLAPVGTNRSTPIASPSTSPPRAKAHHRQDTIVPNGQASPKLPSSHSRAGSNASSASSLRSPVNRVSSPLRHSLDLNDQKAALPSHPPPKASHPYESSDYAPSITTSSSSLRSVSSQQGVSLHGSYALPSSNAPLANPYEPKSVSEPQRKMSPSSLRSASPDLYAPPKTVPSYAVSQYRGRSSSSASTLSSSAAPDVPQLRNEYGLGSRSHVGEPSSYGSVSAYPMVQDVHMPPANRPSYAPSPSLLGSNDPLGRTSSLAPIISFGFGGKMLTCFHRSADLNTGFDVALSSRRTTNITIRALHKLLPEYALEAQAEKYPGPLFSDPGSPVASLVRTGPSQLKAKKARVIKYLEERAEVMSSGTMYISDVIERQQLEGKLVLVRLLKIMVENDGVLSGSPQIDTAVRAALLPRIAGTIGEVGQDGLAVSSLPAFGSPTPNAYGLPATIPVRNEAPISVSTLLPSSLDKIQEFLVRGQRRQAYHYALDEKLWAHALIIASSMDKEAWKEAVNEFLKAELGAREAHQHTTPSVRGKDVLPPQPNGREWLRVAYSVFSGQGPAAVQELVPTSLLSRATTGLQVPAPALSHITPMSPNFPSAAAAAQIPAESLSKWPEIAASIVSSPLNPECSATLTALGDYLLSHHLIEGAHACYLLSPQSSIMGGVGSPGARMVLLGSPSPHTNPTFFRDSDPIIFTEIAEFALSLKTLPKGQEPFHGFPHFQSYKLIRAAYLADIGHVEVATRYCEAITAAMGRPSPYFTPPLVEGLRDLADRLIGSPHMDKSVSWIGGKVNKPSLDSIGSWLEGRLTKFIAGEGDEPSPPTDTSKAAQFAGPFSAHGSISSTAKPASPYPPMMTNSNSTSAALPPRRSGSAMALPSTQTHIPIDRASSAMEYYRPTRNASPAPPKTAPLHSTGYPYSSYVTQTNGHGMTNGYVPAYGSEPSLRKASLEMTAEEGSEPQSAAQDEPHHHQHEGVENNQQPQEPGGWWKSLNGADSAPTPTAATFHHVKEVRELGDGFISLMDDPALSVASNRSVSSSSHRVESGFEDEEDDLGLGNSTHKKRQEESAKSNGDHKPAPSPTQETAKPEGKQDTPQPAAASTGSWLSKLWKRSDTPGPIKASLGEETSFYYDKELKRWVNKKGGAEAGQPQAPAPPPSRAQTASPSGRGSHPNDPTNGTTSAPPQAPPPRTASAIDLSTSPTAKAPMRTRSNLVPNEIASMPNTPPPGPGSMPPPRWDGHDHRLRRRMRGVDM
ncbi:Sec23-binding domain of Sec16-domain-containing protein [Melanogaster broomeanus]|nr:Sec23-binding domain of Sec16-domain-containing protein [Melanogaster broomeanus]